MKDQMSQSEITLLREPEAQRNILNRVLVFNPMASLFKQTLEKFVTSLYESGYLLALISEQADKLNLPVTVGGINFFGPEYAQEFILCKAEEHKLPVNMIKKDLEKLVLDLYEKKYIFGACQTPETTDKVKRLLAGTTGTVKLVLKPTVPETPERAPQDATLQDHP